MQFHVGSAIEVPEFSGGGGLLLWCKGCEGWPKRLGVVLRCCMHAVPWHMLDDQIAWIALRIWANGHVRRWFCMSSIEMCIHSIFLMGRTY